MGYFEAAVVVYLRAIYYPEGFTFPLKAFTDSKIVVEVFREIASIGMLVSVAAIAGRRFWERFAWFMLAFAVWDIFYYVFLKIALDWPAALFTWDILFLIPIPWIGPVIAPVSISILMIIASALILKIYAKGSEFRPPVSAFILSLTATALILYSFMNDTAATLHQRMPKPYIYPLLVIGDILYIAAFVIAYLKSHKDG
jgi:hypothetical protein